MTASRTAARIFADQLVIHGADTIFGVPGESYLDLLDAIYDTPSLRFVTCRQEGGATMMADAHAKLTGKPGICAVTRAPGATNASAGIHIAEQDATPLILLVGHNARAAIGRKTFQEVDYRQMFGGMAKEISVIEDATRIPEIVSKAFHMATSGRPGPVVIVLPEDMLADVATVADARPYQAFEPYPAPEQMNQVREALLTAHRPCVILGGSQWDKDAKKCLEDFATANALPVVTEFIRNDRFDNRHPSYGGNCGLGGNPHARAFLKDSDLIIAIGGELGEISTERFTSMEVPAPRQRLIHILPDADRLGIVYQPEIGIVASPRNFCKALTGLAPVPDTRWAPATAALRKTYEEQRAKVTSPGAVQMSEIMYWLEDNLPDDTIFTNGAGNFRVWLHRFHQYGDLGTQVASTSGSMGYGVPAGVASKIICPDQPVVTFCGDGDFLMTGQEFATAMLHDAPLIVIVVNNGMYGTIRADQERHFPHRQIATRLHNPDFAALARAFGGHGETVEATADFAPAFERARASGKPAIVEIRIDPEAITVDKTISQLRPA